MKARMIKALGGSLLVAVLAMGGASPALAAKAHHRVHHARRHASNASTSTTGTGSSEAALTGDTLSSASAAALAAVPGATVTRASTETDGSVSGAAYEVHVTKSNGSHVVVIESSSFTVLATQAAGDGCGGATSSTGTSSAGAGDFGPRR